MAHSDDRCPQCNACYCDRCVAKMTDEQADLLKNDLCPFCKFKLQ